MRALGILFAATLMVVACGDDDGGGTDSGTTDTGTTDTGTTDTGTMDTGTTDTGVADTGTDTGSDDAGPDDAGPDDAGADTAVADSGADSGGPSTEATAFCGSYETTCTYGGADRFADEAACLMYFDLSAVGCQTCISTHLGLAASNATLHCPHAMGMGPCAGPCSG